MSCVTNIIIKLPLGEEDRALELDANFKGILGYGIGDDVSIFAKTGGNKRVEQSLWVLGVNGFDREEFCKILLSMHFKDKHELQVFCCEQNQNRFEEINWQECEVK
jgi:hypothetical protein